MQGLHLSINDVKLIDLKNPRFMHSNRTPWENDDNTPWAYNSSNTRSFYPNLQHEISPSNFLNSLLKKIFWEKNYLLDEHTSRTWWLTLLFLPKFHDKSRPNLKISRPLGSFASVDNAEFLSFPKNKSNENTVLLISITSITMLFLFRLFFS